MALPASRAAGSSPPQTLIAPRYTRHASAIRTPPAAHLLHSRRGPLGLAAGRHLEAADLRDSQAERSSHQQRGETPLQACQLRARMSGSRVHPCAHQDPSLTWVHSMSSREDSKIRRTGMRSTWVRSHSTCRAGPGQTQVEVSAAQRPGRCTYNQPNTRTRVPGLGRMVAAG